VCEYVILIALIPLQYIALLLTGFSKIAREMPVENRQLTANFDQQTLLCPSFFDVAELRTEKAFF
jgi:hypothetical protein